MTPGAASDWFEARRSELNQRFERARRRFPALSPEAVLAALTEVLVPLAGPEPKSGDLLSSLYDLVLLHCGRETFAARPGVGLLFQQAFPRMRHLLLERPSVLPGALSNAVENMGVRGPAFVEALAGMAPKVDSSDVLLDAVAVLAWRFGEARLRESALEIAVRLPPAILLEALDVADWPARAAPLLIESLKTDGWIHPRRLFTDATLRALSDGSASHLASLRAKADPPPSRKTWLMIARAGDFAGFDGDFASPPLLLDGGSRHHWLARCGAQDFRIDADIFGWICRPSPRMDLPVRTPDAPLRREMPELARATSCVSLPDLLAATHADSHRIRILSPPTEPQ